MKKTLLLLTFLGSTMADAQLIVTPNPFSVNSGIVTVTYGSSGNYSLYDPQSNPNLYLYTGLETDGNAATWDYRDTWSDLSSQTPLTWNATANAYVASLNIGGRGYTQEATNTFMTLPVGTNVNNWYFIIRNAAGTSQSGDLQGTNYGFTPSLSTSSFEGNAIKFNVVNNAIVTDAQGKITIEIYSLLGQKVWHLDTENYNSLLEIPLQLNQKGIYIATLKNNDTTKSVKFTY